MSRQESIAFMRQVAEEAAARSREAREAWEQRCGIRPPAGPIKITDEEWERRERWIARSGARRLPPVAARPGEGVSGEPPGPAADS